jgi:hypothetical protein
VRDSRDKAEPDQLQVEPHQGTCADTQIELRFFPSCLEYYEVLCENIFSSKVFNPVLFRYMVVCQAIFGYKLGVQSHKYFHFFFPLITDAQVTEIIVLLEYLVRNLKNKSSILVYLQALLEFERSQPSFYSLKLDDINFIIELLEESKYF